MKKLIREEEVREAAKTGKSIHVDSNTVFTPSAKDMAKELSVTIVDENDTASTVSQKVQQKWPFHKIAIASDHGGFYMKEELKTFLRDKDFMIIDLGPANANACDYPDYAIKTAEMVSEGKADVGIMIDSVGIGSAMAANRVPGILAAKCNNVTEAKSAREHNYANLLTLGSKIIGSTAANDIVLAFLNTKGGAERHQARIAKILNYKAKGSK
ncbi:MAG: RpiB/LacA/LacB family sugar-phosphate isomerase [Calditrichaeota bacterium]|nr:MAG: RpiB/LacA/LacB family sugar-phosphate isomerase [Calditrichota bacterium]MBL1204079.1 RpiB/LacA/LacB family sugar-phosphate isomerase [Calditrichota bacterium]NOG43909.1 RpiB/LacA/LacB family sugar-phosphate isomerase [Calditrichota bacterium]